MPIYEYTCPQCGETFEKLVRSFSDSTQAECPSCGSAHCRKSMSVFASSVSGRDTGGANCGPTGG